MTSLSRERTCIVIVGSFVSALFVLGGCCDHETECEPAVRIVQEENGRQRIADQVSGYSVEYVLLIGCEQTLDLISEGSMDGIRQYFHHLLISDPAKVASLEKADDQGSEARQSVCSDINTIVGSEAVEDVLVLGFFMDDVWLPESKPGNTTKTE